MRVLLCNQHFLLSSRMPVVAKSSLHSRPWRLPVSAPLSRRHSRSSRRVTLAAATDPYQILGIPRTATEADIKKAFRKKALKLHPDVNKAPDAKERFMECKNAYQMLIDREKQQASSGSSRYNSSNKSYGSSTTGYRAGTAGSKTGSKEQEEWYGLGDLFRDLEDEFAAYSKKRNAKSSGPRSLWEELADIGEELVDFLEMSAGLSDSEPSAPPKTSSSSYSKTKDYYTSEKKVEPTPPPPPPKSRKEIIEDDLAALKKKMGLDK